MMPIAIESIDKLLENSSVRSILLVCQKLERYKDVWNQEKNEHDTLLKLRNREDAFVARAAQKGIKITPVLHSELTEERIKSDGPFDLVAVAGEVTYQSFSIASRVRKFLPTTPTVVEFCETTYDQLANKLIFKNSRQYNVEDLLQSLVYLTATSKQPRILRSEM